MQLAVRAIVAVSLLVGAYVLALAVVGVTVLLGILVVHDASGPALKLFALAVLASGALLRGLWAGLRARRGDGDTGLLVSRESQPELWATVDRLAAAVGTKGPDEIRLIPAVNAAVSEHSSMLGLRHGKRIMYIGIPLIEAFSTAELQAVLAHELGHYSGRHTALGPLVYRGHIALEQLILHLRFRPFVRRLFVSYAKLFFRVSGAVSRRQEFEADAASAAIAGSGPTTSALSRLPSITVAWRFFLDTYVVPPVRANVVPDGLAYGFRSLISEPQRQQELAAIAVGEKAADPYDTHPPLHERIAALRTAGQTGPDDAHEAAPAATLLRDFDAIEAAMPGLLLNEPLPPVSWDEAASRVGLGEAEAASDALLRAAATCGGTATLTGVLDLLEAGRAGGLAAALAPKAKTVPGGQLALRWALQQTIVQRLTNQGRASWTVSWTGAPWQPSGVDLSGVDARIDAALESPAAVPALRAALKKLGVTDPG
jgi:Zn-dependent protease with chaperone function